MYVLRVTAASRRSVSLNSLTVHFVSRKIPHELYDAIRVDRVRQTQIVNTLFYLQGVV